MNQQAFIDGMSHAACTVSVITTDGPAGRAGVTVSAMTSVSAEPPTLLVCVHQQSSACELLKKNGVLCVNVLGEDQSQVSDTFAGRIKSPDGNKFSCASWNSRQTGAPALVDALIAFDCVIKQHHQVGTHIVFIAEPVDIQIRQTGRALIYANRAYGSARELNQFIGHEGDSAEKDCLRIACFATIGPFFIPRLVRGFLADNPATRFELFEGTEREIEIGIADNRFDLVLMYDSPAIQDDHKEQLAATSPHVLLPARHALASKHRISLHDLADQPMVLLDISPSRDYFTSLFNSQELEPMIRFRSPSFETVRGMVANGLGFSLLVSKPANNMSYDGNALISRPIEETVNSGSVIMRRTGNTVSQSELVDSFANHCLQFFADWGI